MKMWTEVRRRVLNKELSKRAACKEYSIHWDTLAKILEHVEPPGYQQAKPRSKPKIGPFLPIIHKILEDDRQAPRKQRHTAKRIFDRLVDEHQFDGGYTIVKDAVRAWKQTSKEVFLPLSHPMGEAQVDYGFAQVELDGIAVQVALIDEFSFGPDFGNVNTADDLPGLINDAGSATSLSAPPGNSDEALLFSVPFRVTAPGTALLDISHADNSPFFDTVYVEPPSVADPSVISYVSDSVMVGSLTGIPEPSTFALATLGLLSLGVTRRRRPR